MAFTEVLTIDEINARFKDEWVLIVDPENDEDSGWIVRGRVEFHSKSREELDRAAMASQAGHIAFHYAGKRPYRIYALNI